MKSMCVVFAGLLLCVSTPRAEDRIEFYADAAMSSCVVTDVAPGLVQIHMFHTGSLPARAAFFAAFTPTCWVGATWLGDVTAPGFTPAYFSTHSPGGLLILYNACLTPPVYLGYMNFVASGQGLPCCEYSAHASLGPSPEPMTTLDCVPFGYRLASARPAIINGNANCPCELPVSTVETTWGRVKALYR